MNRLQNFPAPAATHGRNAERTMDLHASARDSITGHGGEIPQLDTGGRLCDSLAPVPPPQPDLQQARRVGLVNDASATKDRSSSFPEALASSASDPFPASAADWAEAEALAALCRQFLALRQSEAYSANQAARALGKSPSTFSGDDSILARFQRGGVAALLPRRRETGAKPVLFTDLPSWFIPAAQFYYLLTNRTRTRGSVPEAIRRTISLPTCPPHWDYKVKARFLSHLGLAAPPICPTELRETILAREREGKPMLTSQIMRRIAAPEIAVRSVRAPRNAWLDYVQSPGSLMLTRDELTGLERYVRPGEWFTIDDATINFPCVVPLEKPGDPCWDKWRVMVGRFQFLLVVDHRTYFIPGWSYTARPRSSYRAEDLTATMHNTFVEHGRPKVMVMEHGISAANLVTETLGALAIKIQRAASPHQKVVELVFNKLWTKLSQVRGQVGRHRGEEEEANRLLESCRTGATDPRRHFASLAEVLAALRAAIAEHNAGIISGRYGRWVPQEWWASDAQASLTSLSPNSAWMFSPVITPPLKVDGFLVKTSVNIMPGYSQKFAFESSCLGEFHGAKVKLFFNPLAPDCIAKVVLAQNWGSAKADTVLGDAVQFDREARYTRRLLEYGFDPDIGPASIQQHAQALRRCAQAVRPGRQTATTVEVRDGLGASTKIEISPGVHSPETPQATSAEAGRLPVCPVLPDCAPMSAGENRGGGNLSPERLAEAERWEAEHALDFL